MNPIPVFCWTGTANFGDLLFPPLLQRFSDLSSKIVPIEKAKLVGVGSVLQSVPVAWTGFVVGSGKLFEHTNLSKHKAKFLAVRGPLTAKGLKGDLVLGDPGLLADELVELPCKTHKLGLVAHWSDKNLAKRKEFLKYDPLIIDVAQDPKTVIRQIGQCEKIVTSSLHGAILADAFQIPRRLVYCGRFDKEGKDFKWRDYHASISMPLEWEITRDAPRYNVEARQHELFDLFTDLDSIVRRG